MLDLRVSEGIKRYLEFVSKKNKPATHRFYAGRLVSLDRRFGAKRCRRMKKSHFEEHFEKSNKWPDGSDKAPDTQRGNILAVEQLQKWWLREKIIRRVVELDIRKPAGRWRERLPTADEIEAIKKHTNPEFNLIYEALRRCGSRPSEMGNADIDDWDRENCQIVLTDHKTATKTGRPRLITVADKLEEILLAAIGDRTTGPIFLSPRKRRWTVPHMSATYRRARIAAGLPGDLVLYLTRHSFGTAAYEAFGELATAKLMGHVGTSMLPRYCKVKKEKRISMQDSLAI